MDWGIKIICGFFIIFAILQKAVLLITPEVGAGILVFGIIGVRIYFIFKDA